MVICPDGVRDVMAGDITQEALQSLRSLDDWVERNGWAGYDPYDIKGHPLILKTMPQANAKFAARLARVPLTGVLELLPGLSRRLLGVRPEVNAKAMGLFASAYLRLHQRFGGETYLDKAHSCIDWLERNKVEGYAGACWGYPFDWLSLILIPRNTPSAVVTSACGNAFWASYQITRDKRYLDTCESICRFFLTDLNIDDTGPGGLCFSYTPLDRFHIHNANLFVAEFLLKVGKEMKQEDFYKRGLRALNYTLDAQNEDGSFYYWALSDREKYNIPTATLKNIDHYHTGFVLRSLHSIYETTGDQRVLDGLTRGYQFYRDNLFAHRTIPKIRLESQYPVNVHSCAEAILCMSTLSDAFPDAGDYAWNAFRWTRDKMQNRDGYFYYMKTPLITFKMPYIRWGQAWMLLALASLLTTPREEGQQ